MGTPPSFDEVLAAACASLAPDAQAWLVGGCLRDQLLGLPIKDVDIAVTVGAETLARGLADRLGAAAYATSEAFGTWRVVLGNGHVDVARLRPAHAGAEPADPLTTDLLARDFTFNAMARPLAGGDLIDPLGGADDLRAGCLRLCARRALDDDPLRVVRAARFGRALLLTPDAEALAAATAAAPSLRLVSGERVRDELSALLASRGADAALRDLAAWGALAVVLPEVDALRGIEQTPYHHLDAFEHTLEALTYVRGVVEQLGGAGHLAAPAEAGLPGASPLVPVSWAVLLHDIGKPAARAVSEDGRLIFWYHDEIGASQIDAIAERLRLSARFSAYLRTLVRQHLRLGFLVREQPLTRRALSRYRRAVSPWVFESVVVSLCDRLATRGEKTSPLAMARHYRVARSVWTAVNKSPLPRLVTGEEVMDLLSVREGPIVGSALEALEEEVEVGEVTSAEEAREFLRAWWEGQKIAARDDTATHAGESV